MVSEQPMQFRTTQSHCLTRVFHVMRFWFFDFFYVGLGVYNYPDGRCYIGQYKDDRRHGQGSETAADGTVLYSGNWSNGEFIDE
jgi:hypothetical protein